MPLQNFSALEAADDTSLHDWLVHRMDSPLFELLGPDGQCWEVFEDGHIFGFPEGTRVINHAVPLLNALRCRANIPRN